jgi:hypothetical protein
MEFQSPQTGPDGPPDGLDHAPDDSLGDGLAGALNGCLDEATQRWLDDGPAWDDDAAWGEPGDEWPDDEFGDECSGGEGSGGEFGGEGSGDEFEFDLAASFAEDHHQPTPTPTPVPVSDRVEWALVAAEVAIDRLALLVVDPGVVLADRDRLIGLKRPEFCAASMRVAALG